MSKIIQSDVILQGRKNWDTWISIVQDLAEAAGVWKYIDPDSSQQLPQEPEKPVDPTAVIDDGSPGTEPTAEAVALYTAKLNAYYKDLKELKHLQDKLGKIQAHVTKTIPQDLVDQIKRKGSVRMRLKALQGMFAPLTIDREFEVRKAYNSARTLHIRRENIEDWCDNLLRVYNRAKDLNLADVYGFRPHADLVQAIRQYDTGHASNVASRIFKAEKEWRRDSPIPEDVQFQNLVNEFAQYYRITHSNKTNIHGGAFGATFNQEESPYNNGNQNDKKRPREEKKPKKPCLCGDIHFWGQCLYIDTSLRPRGFVEDPEKAKKIADYEAKDAKGILNKIREKNRRFKKMKGQGTSKRTESDSIEIDAGDDPAHQFSHEAYAVYSSAFNNQLASQHCPLLHSWTLDPATDIHICNNPDEFQWKEAAAPDDIVLAGGSEMPIKAWGEVTISLSTPKGNKSAKLKKVALIPSFFTSLVQGVHQPSKPKLDPFTLLG